MGIVSLMDNIMRSTFDLAIGLKLLMVQLRFSQARGGWEGLI